MSNQFSLGGFALDLGPLEKSSGMIITDRKRTASVVDSEDDGPSDFTLNMGKWMKGTTIYTEDTSKKGQVGDAEAVEQLSAQQATASEASTCRDIPDEVYRDPFDFVNDSQFTEPLGSSTPSPRFISKRPTVEDVPDDSVYPLPAQAHSRSAEKNLPAAASAPSPPAPLSRRNSGSQEDIATKSRSRSISPSQQTSSTTARSRSNSSAQQASSTTSRPQSKSGAQHAVTTDSWSQNNPRNSQRKKNPYGQLSAHIMLDDNIQPSPAPLSRLNTETKQNRAAEEVFSHISSLQAEVERLRQENQQLRSTNSTLTSELEACKDTMTVQQQTIRAQESERISNMGEMAKLNHELAAARARARDHDSSINAKVAALEAQHEEETIDIQKEHAATLRSRNAQIENFKTQHEEDIVELQREHASTLRKRNAQIETLKSQHEEDIMELQQHHASTLRDRDLQIATLKSQYENHLTNLRHNHASTLQAHDAEITTLKSQHGTDLTALRRTHATTLQDLQTTQIALSSTKHELSSTQNDLETARTDLDAAEKRFSIATEAREAEWRKRIETLFKEREKMSKALLTAWGRNEMGDTRGKEGDGKAKGQAYRYRYAKAC